MDHRQAAKSHVDSLLAELRSHSQPSRVHALVAECEALSRAIAAFHMEGIRFRMYNVDRLLHRGDLDLPSGTAALFSEARRELEAAGFHTRSHQAPSEKAEG